VAGGYRLAARVLPQVAVAVAGRGRADVVLVRAVTAQAAVPAGAVVMDGLRRAGKIIIIITSTPPTRCGRGTRSSSARVGGLFMYTRTYLQEELVDLGLQVSDLLVCAGRRVVFAAASEHILVQGAPAPWGRQEGEKPRAKHFCIINLK